MVNVKGTFAMAMNITEVKKMAQTVVDLYKNHPEKLIKRAVDLHTMKKWANGENSVQTRFELLDHTHVANIFYRIELQGDLSQINPPLCSTGIKNILKLIDGNHTNKASLKAIVKKIVDAKGIDVLVIPDEYLPNNDEDREQVFEAIGVIMNKRKLAEKEPKPVDIKRQINNHIINNTFDVEEPSYRKELADMYGKKEEDIRSYIYEVRSKLKKSEGNHLNNFFQYPKEAETIYKADRNKKFRKQNRNVGITWAVLDKKKKLPEILGKSMGNAMDKNEIHIIFHFLNFEDVSTQGEVETFVKDFSKKYNVKFGYEFLPWEGCPKLLEHLV
jgi:hypothetical protein